MAAKLEVAVHTAMSGEKALCLRYRFEPLHLPLSSPGRLMRNLYSVVQISALPVLDLRQDVPFGGSVTFQFVGHEHTGRLSAATEQLPKETLGRFRVAVLLHQDIQDYPVLIDGPPEIMDFAPDPDKQASGAG